MKPHRVEIGDRYEDNSGWEKLVSLDLASKRLFIDIGGAEASFDSGHIGWLIMALQTAQRLTAEHVPLEQ